MKKIVFFNTEDQSDLSIESKMVEGLDYELTLMNNQDNQNVAEVCKDADAIISIYTPMTADVLKKITNCKVISLQAIGFNNLDLQAATEQGICCTNIPDYCVYDVAVHTVTLLLACARHLTQLNNQVKAGKWGYSGHVMNRLDGKTFGTIGFGNIPKRITPIVQSLGMKVLTFDPWVSDEVLKTYGVQRAASIDEMIVSSDYISVHCPLTPQNMNIIGEHELSMMKPDAFLINIARGRLVDENALCSALENKQIAGVGLDVLENEKDGDNPLYHFDNVIVTPHIAFYSEESTVDMRIKAMEQVLQVLEENHLPSHLINRDVAEKAKFLK